MIVLYVYFIVSTKSLFIVWVVMLYVFGEFAYRKAHCGDLASALLFAYMCESLNRERRKLIDVTYAICGIATPSLQLIRL